MPHHRSRTPPPPPPHEQSDDQKKRQREQKHAARSKKDLSYIGATIVVMKADGAAKRRNIAKESAVQDTEKRSERRRGRRRSAKQLRVDGWPRPVVEAAHKAALNDDRSHGASSSGLRGRGEKRHVTTEPYVKEEPETRERESVVSPKPLQPRRNRRSTPSSSSPSIYDVRNRAPASTTEASPARKSHRRSLSSSTSERHTSCEVKTKAPTSTEGRCGSPQRQSCGVIRGRGEGQAD